MTVHFETAEIRMIPRENSYWAAPACTVILEGLENDGTTSVHDLDSRTCARARTFPLINEHVCPSLVASVECFDRDLYRHSAEIAIFRLLRKNVISTGYTRKLGTRVTNPLKYQQIRCTHRIPKLGTRVGTAGYSQTRHHLV